jgi:ligand-binding sensor domain-containing protein/signal transduction histidine kinase
MSLLKMDNRRCNPLLLGCLLLVLIAPSRAFALDRTRSIYQYNCRSWARQNGLPANAVLAIAQTPDGYLWLGTSAGLVRFDGVEFKLFDSTPLPKSRSSIVTSLSNSRQGGLWFGMERGAFGYFDGRDISLLGRDEWSGMNLDVHSIRETKNGDLWIAAEILAARLTKAGDFETVLTNAVGTARYDVTALYEDSHARIWLGTAQRGLYYWQAGELNRFPDPVFDELTIRSFVEDRQGQLWIGTDRGLLCYDADFQRQPFPYPWYATRALLVDRQGTLWIGTSGGGLVRYLNGIPIELRQKDGLADDFVASIMEDDEGSLWVGTRNGLSQISDVRIPTFGKTEGLTAEVNVSVNASRTGGLWVATSGGITYFDGTAHLYPTNRLKNAYINGVWEARNGDLFLVNGSMDIEVFSNGKVVASYPNKSWPQAMAEDAHGMVVSVGGDLFRVNTNGLAPYVFSGGHKPPLNWIFNMASSWDGAIWIAGDEGICRVKDGTYELWSTTNGPAISKVQWICEDPEGVVWAGLEIGLARFKDGRIRNITRDDGLFDNNIKAIVPDDHGDLWVDSSRGFFRVSRRSLNEFADGKSSRVECFGFDGPDAVKSAEKYQQQPSGCKTLDGRIWFPTAQGIVMIDPTNITAVTPLPKVHIQSVRANGRELVLAANAVAVPGNGDLEFHYGGLSFIAPLKIQYRYKLVGYDKDWVDAGARRAAFYTNLKPGKYQFEVQACNGDRVWNVTGDTFAVELLPRFYQTAWFMVVAGTSVVAGLFGLYVWRLSRLKRKQQQLQEARDLLEAKVMERTAELKDEIEERKRIQLEAEQIHVQLLDASRQAGQAEVASSVLHNVGNVLNSVNVSTNLIAERLRGLRVGSLSQAAQMMQEHMGDIGPFLTTDEKGRQLPQYLEKLARHLGREQEELLREIKDLAGNVDHIKEIVAMQQTYAKAAGLLETVPVSELVESSLRMDAASFERHGVKVVREFREVPPVLVDKHKVLQILVNLLHNARNACDESGREDKQVTLRIRRSTDQTVAIEVADNGIGIAPENWTNIFSHGFTTRQSGHGFGLHSAALAAQEMGGTLSAQSDGLGTGATFILEIPLEPASKEA